MNNKIVKEIRKTIKIQFPELENNNPKEFKKLVKKIKNRYKDVPWNEKLKIEIK